MGYGGEMTKEEIQTDYNKLAGNLGEKVYRLFLPLLEIHHLLHGIFLLNQEAHKVQKEEAASQDVPVGVDPGTTSK